VAISDYKLSEPPKLVELESYSDFRGDLLSLELSKFDFGFCRFFMISFSSTDISRGEHAHKKCAQFLFSASGFNVLSLNLGGIKNFQILPGWGLLVPPYNWIQISSKVPDCKIVVLASEPYDPADYIKERPILENS